MALFRIAVKKLLNQNQQLVSRLNQTQLNLRNLSASTDLKDVLEEKIESERIKITKFRKQYGDEQVSQVDVNQVYGGMRGVTCMLWETSLLDPDEGIRFRGMTIPEVQKALPKADGGEEPLPEGIFWLLATGDIPNKVQVKALSKELAKRAHLPKHITTFLNTVPKTLHPMCQFSCAVALLNHDSQFIKAYDSGVKKLDYWKYIFEDALTLIANLTVISATIYVRNYKDGKLRAEIDENKDWSYNYCKMIGFDSKEFIECMRMYFTIHCDHEGANVAAHTAHIVGSALGDPFISFASALNGLAGPLHGLANQEVLRWIIKLKDTLGNNPDEATIRQFIKETLKTGVVPGFGHAVLRKTDPRYICQREFALKHLPEDPLFKIVKVLYKLVPPELEALGKVKNPWPNVDAHSGVLLHYYGLKEMEYYTVLFGISRCLGVMAQNIWSRALLLPIERPKSITTKELMAHFKYNPD